MNSTDTQPQAEGAQAQAESSPAGFSPIMTQEDFDRAIKARLERAKHQFRAENEETFRKAAAYDEQIEKNKSDLEKANDRAAKAEAELADLRKREEIASWKQEISKETGVPADVLRGSTKEELIDHAESLKGAFSASRAPVVKSDGFAPTSEANKSTRDQFADAISNFLGD